MRDTAPAAEAAFRARFDALTPVERARMGFDRLQFARKCARIGIRKQHPELTDAEVEQRLFLRMYGDELSADTLERELARIAARFG
jgi:hypothetical protein